MLCAFGGRFERYTHINLQSIVGRFADFQFSKRDNVSQLAFYQRAYEFNKFLLNFISYDMEYRSSIYIRIFDQNKKNFYKSLSYLHTIVVDNEWFDYLDSLTTKSTMSNSMQDKEIEQLEQLKADCQEDDLLVQNFIETLILGVNYFRGDFDNTFRQIKKEYPLKEITAQFDIKNTVERYSLNNIMNIY
ncbi:MAG: hypothetical protein ACYC04_01800 [Sulfurovum sp.]